MESDSTENEVAAVIESERKPAPEVKSEVKEEKQSLRKSLEKNIAK